ncbi:type II toxin-antitoxin system PemK/MazF family toxin [bacterium]|nr:type II toxin-antitoxin system PemK/MazF family toxin [bacterium]
MVISQYEIYLISLDPTIGHEMKKTRPCVVISPDDMNEYLETVIIAPITSKEKHYPTRIEIKLKNRKCWIVADQVKTIDRKRIIKKMGMPANSKILKLKSLLEEMLVK